MDNNIVENYFRAIDKKVEEEIDKNQTRIDKKKEQIRNPKKKPSLFEKLGNDSDLKRYQERGSALTQISQKVYQLRFMESDTYSLPEHILDSLNAIAAFLPENEQKELTSLVREAVRNSSKGKKEKVDELNKQITKLLKNAGIENSKLFVHDRYGNTLSSAPIGLDYALDKASSQLKQQFKGEFFIITPGELEDNYLSLTEEVMLKELNEIRNDEAFNKDPDLEGVCKHYYELEREFKARAKAEQMNLLISNTVTDLSRETTVDFSKVIDYLNKLSKMNQRLIERATKYIEQYNFDKINEKIREKRKEEEKQNAHQAAYQNYAELAYELETVLINDPNNYERINEIESMMREVARTSDLSNGDLQMASIEGKERYYNETRSKQAIRESIQENMDAVHEMKAESQRYLREEAIRLLESRGAFDDLNEVRNGDVYTNHDAVEALIERTMEELKSAPTYTASEKEQATNIYRDYIRYRANLEDKTQFMTFSQYARNVHGMDYVTEEMVEEEVRGMKL